jgi:hypothetical protein
MGALQESTFSLVVIFLLFNLILNSKRKKFSLYVVFFIISIVSAYLTLINNWPPIVKTVIFLCGSLSFYKGTVPNKIMATVSIIQLGIILDFINHFFMGEYAPEGTGSIVEIFMLGLLIVFNIFRREKEPLVQYFTKTYLLIWLQVSLNFILVASVTTNMDFSGQAKVLISTILILTSGISIYFCYYLEKTKKIRLSKNKLNFKKIS